MSRESGNLVRVAKVLKSNGTQGGLMVGFREYLPEDLNLKEPVFIHFDGLPVPFFIESLSRKGPSKAIVTLTGIRNLEDADEVAGLDIFARKEDLLEYEDEDEGISIEDLPGWTILGKSGDPLGEIADYEDIPGNPCLYVQTSAGVAMIPLHEDFIVSVDEEKREIALDLPDGLI